MDIMIRAPIAKGLGSNSIHVFSQDLQEQFASLCGDRNPMHMDEIAARRTQAGASVVHGMHVLLWTLDALVSAGLVVTPISRVKTKFTKWIYVGDQVQIAAPSGLMSDPPTVNVEARGVCVMCVELEYGGREHQSAWATEGGLLPEARRQEAAELSFSELRGRSGVALTATADEASAMFPALSSQSSAALVAELAACSYVVGMEVPGLYSTFSRIDVELHRGSETSRCGLRYEVASQDERFNKATISVRGNCIAGQLVVFSRQPPVRQASMETVAAAVQGQEFRDVRALIVGGSRGLGELTAKIIAAGGGRVTLTYSVGKEEAEEVAFAIRSWGGTAETMRFDVREPALSQLAAIKVQPSHVFYFATSAIFRSKDRLVSVDLLNDFSVFYLIGFFELCSALVKARQSCGPEIAELIAYYPSSVALDDRPAGMTEYAMVKAAGEQMCRDMNHYMPGLRILTTRLPRLKTDQTATVLPVRESDPVMTMLDIARRMKAGRIGND